MEIKYKFTYSDLHTNSYPSYLFNPSLTFTRVDPINYENNFRTMTPYMYQILSNKYTLRLIHLLLVTRLSQLQNFSYERTIKEKKKSYISLSIMMVAIISIWLKKIRTTMMASYRIIRLFISRLTMEINRVVSTGILP